MFMLSRKIATANWPADWPNTAHYIPIFFTSQKEKESCSRLSQDTPDLVVDLIATYVVCFPCDKKQQQQQKIIQLNLIKASHIPPNPYNKHGHERNEQQNKVQ